MWSSSSAIDRLTRSEDLVERGAILGGLQRAGVKVADAMSGQVLDFSTDMGDLFGSLQAVWASMENRKRREKTMEGKISAAQQNRKPQGPTPYGLIYNRETHEWIVRPGARPVHARDDRTRRERRERSPRSRQTSTHGVFRHHATSGSVAAFTTS
jgi:DNA invertase Pin-like site-specific DNA recombinase